MNEEPRAAGRRRPATAPRDRVGLPEASRLALWVTAWIQGTVSLDDARDAVVGTDAAHDVIGLPGTEEPVPLILALGLLRVERVSSAGMALPSPGDPLGLGGPAAFNAEALEVGQAVVCEGAELGLVPYRAGAGVVWRCLPASSRRQQPDLPEADVALRTLLPQVADGLADLDLARWRPEVADELMALRRDQDLDVPPATSLRARKVLGLGLRCRRIVELALEDEGAALTAIEADRRRSLLLPLERAARRAVVAACGAPLER